MISSLVSTITVLFFKPHTRMSLAVQGFDVALKPTGRHETDTFLYFFIGKALQSDSDPLQVFDRLIVKDIYQDRTEEPDHNFIHTTN